MPRGPSWAEYPPRISSTSGKLVRTCSVTMHPRAPSLSRSLPREARPWHQGPRMARVPTVDVHAHVLVPDVEALVQGRAERAREIARQVEQMGQASIRQHQTLMPTYLPKLTDPRIRLHDMDAMGIDVQAVSVSPTQYYYWAERDLARDLVRVANTHVAALCDSHPERFVGLATVALQHPDLAVEQLAHAVQTLGLRGVQISTAIEGVELDDPALEPFWACAQTLGAFAFIHPLGCSLGARLAPYYLSNLVGHPVETTVALSHLIFGGVLDRFPELTVCAAHGGGYPPFSVWRSDHGHAVRPESHTSQRLPSAYLRRLWFDSLVYTPDALRHLIEQVGAGQVVVGTDYPFDMGMDDPLAVIAEVQGLSARDREAICGGTAARLLGIAPGA